MEQLNIGAGNNNNMITLSYQTYEINTINDIMNNGLLDKYLISKGLIPYNFESGGNVHIFNPFMIIDYKENHFIYNNYDLKQTIADSIQNNLQFDNKFHIIILRNINLHDNSNLEDVGNTVLNIINSM